MRLLLIFAFTIAHLLDSCWSYTPVTFNNCGGSLPAQLIAMSVQRTRTASSFDITVYAQANSAVQITAGTVLTTISVLGYQLYNDQSDLCSVLGSCPSGPGDIAASKQFSLPNVGGVWGVDIVGRMQWFDESNTLIGCVDASFPWMEDNAAAEAIANAVIYTIVLGTCILAVTTSGTVWMVSTKVSAAVGQLPSAGAGVPPIAAVHPAPAFPSFVDFVLYLQFLSQAAMLNLNYPDYYAQILAKFGWANFMPAANTFLKDLTQQISPAPSSSQQPSADDPAVPLPVPPTTPSDTGSGFVKIASIIGLNPSQIFLYTSIVFIFAIIAFIALALIVYVCMRTLHYLLVQKSGYSRLDNGQAGWVSNSAYISFAVGNIIRLFYIGYFVLVATSIYQFSRKGDPWGLYLWAAVVFTAFCVFLMGFCAIYLLRYRNSPQLLYDDSKKYLMFGALYNQYAIFSYTFFSVFLVYRLLAGIVIGGAYFSPIAQMLSLIMVELIYMFFLAVRRPFKTRFGNRMHLLASVVRVTAAGLMLAFVPELGASSNTRQIMGYVILALNGLAILMYTSVLIYNIVQTIRLKRKMDKGGPKEQVMALKQMKQRELLEFPNRIDVFSESTSAAGNRVLSQVDDSSISSDLTSVAVSESWTEDRYQSLFSHQQARPLSLAQTHRQSVAASAADEIEELSIKG